MANKNGGKRFFMVLPDDISADIKKIQQHENMKIKDIFIRAIRLYILFLRYKAKFEYLSYASNGQKIRNKALVKIKPFLKYVIDNIEDEA